jgi:hypothetical protein
MTGLLVAQINAAKSALKNVKKTNVPIKIAAKIAKQKVVKVRPVWIKKASAVRT